MLNSPTNLNFFHPSSLSVSWWYGYIHFGCLLLQANPPLPLHFLCEECSSQGFWKRRKSTKASCHLSFCPWPSISFCPWPMLTFWKENHAVYASDNICCKGSHRKSAEFRACTLLKPSLTHLWFFPLPIPDSEPFLSCSALLVVMILKYKFTLTVINPLKAHFLHILPEI